MLRAEYDELIEAGGADRSGNRPLNVPEQVANLWGHYQHGAWQFSLGGRYVGRRYGNNANTLSLPSYVVADASLAWQYDPRTTFRLLGRNLTDEVYATTSYGPTQFMLGESPQLRVDRGDEVLIDHPVPADAGTTANGTGSCKPNLKSDAPQRADAPFQSKRSGWLLAC